ncbi:hypothetical protein CVS40_11740, partial [Lucilia cuprina]
KGIVSLNHYSQHPENRLPHQPRPYVNVLLNALPWSSVMVCMPIGYWLFSKLKRVLVLLFLKSLRVFVDDITACTGS